jgi:hypothetical protein
VPLGIRTLSENLFAIGKSHQMLLKLAVEKIGSEKN